MGEDGVLSPPLPRFSLENQPSVMILTVSQSNMQSGRSDRQTGRIGNPPIARFNLSSDRGYIVLTFGQGQSECVCVSGGGGGGAAYGKSGSSLKNGYSK